MGKVQQSRNDRGSLGAKAFLILRDKILNEEYTKGQKLNEVTLAKALEISRTPIREALKQLELEGLVQSIPNKGVYVIGFSSRDIDDMFEIRLALEGLAIQLAIERMDDEHLKVIKEVYTTMEFYTQIDDAKKVSELNIQFHDSIYQATQSKYFAQLLKDINYYVSVTSRHSILRPQRLDTAIVEHKAILDAIISKDKTLAKKMIKRHIRATQMLVRQYFEQRA
ncbi:MAG: GntR family transcriptional regulator [Erysipelotrichaceae bacterium]|nr:GntR family transcriptional regulator [Erysipelotrichaceae bacterium]